MLHNIWMARLLNIIICVSMFVIGYFLINDRKFKISQLFKQKSNKQKWQNINALMLFISLLYMIHTFVYVSLRVDDTNNTSLFSAVNPLITAFFFLLEICFKSKELRFYKFFLSYLIPVLVLIFSAFDIAPNHEWYSFIICYIPTIISIIISILDILKYKPKKNIGGPILYTISSLWALMLICFEP